jgi:hypothetical protein
MGRELQRKKRMKKNEISILEIRSLYLCTFLANKSKYKTAAVHFSPHAITLSWKYFYKIFILGKL